jgi:hypothetical protein
MITQTKLRTNINLTIEIIILKTIKTSAISIIIEGLNMKENMRKYHKISILIKATNISLTINIKQIQINKTQIIKVIKIINSIKVIKPIKTLSITKHQIIKTAKTIKAIYLVPIKILYSSLFEKKKIRK